MSHRAAIDAPPATAAQGSAASTPATPAPPADPSTPAAGARTGAPAATDAATSTPAATTPRTDTATAAPIPFRQTSVASGADAVGALGITVALLAAAAAAAIFARKRGWLDRWAATPAGAAASTRRLAVTETLRLSRATTVYRLMDGAHEYLVLESSASARLLRGEPGKELSP
jgi:hypothetical protein